MTPVRCDCRKLVATIEGSVVTTRARKEPVDVDDAQLGLDKRPGETVDLATYQPFGAGWHAPVRTQCRYCGRGFWFVWDPGRGRVLVERLARPRESG